MPRIIFLNRYFYPDRSATSQLLGDVVFHLASQGRNVHVVTGRRRYDDAAARLPERDVIRDVHVRRVATTNFGRSGLAGRGLDYLTCYRGMASVMDELAGPGDILVAKTDPPLLSVVAMRAARRRGARLVNWLQDLYPEVAAALGVPLIQGPVARALASPRNDSLRMAETNIVLGDVMAARVRSLGVPDNRIDVIPNWTDDETIVPIAAADNPLRHAWGLTDKFVVGYSGNLGRAHEMDAIITAADRLRGDPRIVFIFIGGGLQFDRLAALVRERGLDRTVRFFPYQERAALPWSLSLPDLHWLSLKPSLEGLIFPSKFYGIAAAGRPMIAVAATDGEIAQLVRRHDCGMAIDPSEGEKLAGVLTDLAGDPRRCAILGANARAMLDANYTHRRALAQWSAMFDRLG